MEGLFSRDAPPMCTGYLRGRAPPTLLSEPVSRYCEIGFLTLGRRSLMSLELARGRITSAPMAKFAAYRSATRFCKRQSLRITQLLRVCRLRACCSPRGDCVRMRLLDPELLARSLSKPSLFRVGHPVPGWVSLAARRCSRFSLRDLEWQLTESTRQMRSFV